MSTPREWSRGYAVQAVSDLQVQSLLAASPLPESHRHHYLQMACEKLCKAYLLDRGSDADSLQSSHAYVAKVLPIIVKQYVDPTLHAGAMGPIRHLAREIELQAPAVNDGGRRPDNCEYPWEEGGRVLVPAERSFPNLSLLDSPAGSLLLKIVTVVARGLARSA